MGAGDSQGVPRWWCGCAVCQEARSTGENARSRPAILIEGTGARVLVDAPPELRLQLTREGVQGLDALLITHAHNDHVLGLGDVADMARWTGWRVPIYAPAEVLPQVTARFPYLLSGSYPALAPFRVLQPPLTLAGYRVSAHRVPHGYNGFAYGLRFEGPGGAWAYVPDSIGITDLEPWRGLELLILGSSFYWEAAPREKRSVYDVLEAMDLLATLKPERAVFTHLGHGVDRRKLAPTGTVYAFDGMKTMLP